MATLTLFLFGAPRLERDGMAVKIPRRKALALLAYLAATGQSHTRDTLATLFWPDHTQSAARLALSRHLSELNLLLPAGMLILDAERVALRDLWVDMNEFEAVVAACPAATTATLPRLQTAVDLYAADFLAGFSLPDCPAFDEWQTFQAESVRLRLRAVLEKIAWAYAAAHDHEAAIAATRRWLALDPLDENAHRTLMQIYAQAGQPTAALRQYERSRQLLADELGALSAPETTELYEYIRHGEAGPGDRRARRQRVQEHVPTIHNAPFHNLPAQTTPFIGRQHDVAELVRLLTDPAVKLVTILAPGGMGKTRLGLAVAEQLLRGFRDGIFFVPLAPLSSPAGWLDVLSLARVAAEIQRGLDILETEQRDVPERQRSVRATFNYSWERLTEGERDVFTKLVVFRGGFAFDAAAAVAGADIRTLRRLVGKSLVQALPLVLVLTGAPDEAERLLDEVVRSQHQTGTDRNTVFVLSIRAHLAFWRGELDAAAQLIQVWQASIRGRAYRVAHGMIGLHFMALMSCIAGVRGDYQQGYALSQQLAASPHTSYFMFSWRSGWGLALAHYGLGNTAAARQALYDVLYLSRQTLKSSTIRQMCLPLSSCWPSFREHSRLYGSENSPMFKPVFIVLASSRPPLLHVPGLPVAGRIYPASSPAPSSAATAPANLSLIQHSIIEKRNLHACNSGPGAWPGDVCRCPQAGPQTWPCPDPHKAGLFMWQRHPQDRLFRSLSLSAAAGRISPRGGGGRGSTGCCRYQHRVGRYRADPGPPQHSDGRICCRAAGACASAAHWQAH